MIAIVDYGVGNVGSVLNMLKKIGQEAAISSDPGTIERADKLILPGVGGFEHGIRQLNATGLVPLLRRRVIEQHTPVMGICLGLQLMTDGSEEGGGPGLGWLNATTVRFQFDSPSKRKVPHMGWNTVQPAMQRPAWMSLPDDSRFYFVHSYHLRCHTPQDVVATANYGYDFPAIVARDNMFGTQFHPEKSHRFGMALLKDFAHR